MLQFCITRECISRDAHPVTDEQGIFALRSKRKRQVGKQSHVTLSAWLRRRHRVPVRYQTVVIRLAKKIAPQQLERIGVSLDSFEQMRTVSLVRATRISKMGLGSLKRKKRQG